MTHKYTWRSLVFLLMFWNSPVNAEYCVNWSTFVQRGTGTSGHCWASEHECNSYVISRPVGDFSGGCQYRPGLYPPTGSQKGGNKSSESKEAANKAAAAQKSKLDAAKREQAEHDQQELQQLRLSLKVPPSAPEPDNKISLKPVPPPSGGLARSQLDCIAHNQSGESWGKRAADCTPVTPGVPEPPSPTRVDVPTNPASLRESIARQDREIAVREHAIAQEELKVADPNKPQEESNALRRAKEALAKAKADRARTAAELARLEQQEQDARKKVAPAAQ
jgi:hypothetical protein